jgi:hypothetical protein
MNLTTILNTNVTFLDAAGHTTTRIANASSVKEELVNIQIEDGSPMATATH